MKCRCGHARTDHDADGRCSLYAEAVPIAGSNVLKQPDGTCYCRGFNGEPWPWVVWREFGSDAWEPDPENEGWQRMRSDAKPYSYIVRQQGTDKEHGPYKTPRGAERKAKALNYLLKHGAIAPEEQGRHRRFAEIAGEYWGEAEPPNPLPRYCVRVSYEDCSDVSDYFVFHDDFGSAEQEYRAYSVWDLDSRDRWKIERSQRAVRC